MKNVKLSSSSPSVADLLDMARENVVLVTTQDGDSFVISSADDFETEVELLRRNHDFLSMLDELKTDTESVPLEEVERRLR